MGFDRQLVIILQYLSLAAQIILLVRLVSQGLHKIYRWFCIYLIYETIRSLAVLPLKPNTSRYALTHIALDPLLWVLYFLIVFELYQLVLRQRPGIATLGRRILLGGTAVAAVVAIFSLALDLSAKRQSSLLLVADLIIGRAVVTTVLLFLLVITTFLVWFPIRLDRNTVYYCFGYVVFFFTKSSALLLRNIVPTSSVWVSVANIGIAVFCLFLWTWKLNAKGAQVQLTVGHGWNQERADELLEQLDSLNTTLAGAAPPHGHVRNSL